jgi:glycyl-tRNA synthetase
MVKDGLPERAKQLYQKLIDAGFFVEYDEAGSIGRRYARADEIGTPLGVTIDYQTLKDGTVTLRNRDTWRQVRSDEEELIKSLSAYYSHSINFDDLEKK